MKGTDREKAIGQMWRELTNAGRATYHRGLKQEPSFGRGGLRVWAPAPLARLPTPPSAAVPAAAAVVPPTLTTRFPMPPSAAGVTVTFLAPGCATAVSVAASVVASVSGSVNSVSAKRTVKTAPPSPDPEGQPEGPTWEFNPESGALGVARSPVAR